LEDQTQIPPGANAKFIKEVDQLGGELN